MKTPEALKTGCEQADKFIALLSFNHIAVPSEILSGSKTFSAASIHLNPKYKDRVNPDRTGQEPFDD